MSNKKEDVKGQYDYLVSRNETPEIKNEQKQMRKKSRNEVTSQYNALEQRINEPVKTKSKFSFKKILSRSNASRVGRGAFRVTKQTARVIGADISKISSDIKEIQKARRDGAIPREQARIQIEQLKLQKEELKAKRNELKAKRKELRGQGGNAYSKIKAHFEAVEQRKRAREEAERNRVANM